MLKKNALSVGKASQKERKKRNKGQMFRKRCLIYFSRTIFSFSNSSDVDATQCICLQLETPPSARVYNPPTNQVPRGLKNPFGRRVSSRGGEKETLRLGTAGLQPQARAQGGVAPLLRNGKIWLKPVTSHRIGWICISRKTKFKKTIFFSLSQMIFMVCFTSIL